MIEKDVINFRRYVEFMERLQEEILCYTPPSLSTNERSQQLGSWVRRELQSVPPLPVFDDVVGKSARIDQVMALEEKDRKNRTVGRRNAGF
jgi:hypothetical protein